MSRVSIFIKIVVIGDFDIPFLKLDFIIVRPKLPLSCLLYELII